MGKSKQAANGIALVPKTSGFDYSQLPASMRSHIMAETATIRKFIGQTAKDMIQVGLRLEQVHTVLGRNRYQAWARAEFGWSPSTASKWRQAAAVFGTLDCVDRFDSSALCALARHKVSVAARNEALSRARRGEMITHQGAEIIILSHRNGAKQARRPKRLKLSSAVSMVEGLFQKLSRVDVAKSCAELEQAIVRVRSGDQSNLVCERETPSPTRERNRVDDQ